MAQAARPLPSPRDQPAQRPRLRAVPPPRRPPPEVIRRRRALALGGLLGLIGVPLAVLALTAGGGGSDAQQIRSLLARGAAEPATLCDHLSTGMLRAVGGRDACVAASPTRAPSGEIDSISIDGATAHAVVVQDTGTEMVRLVRQDGEWKVDDVR